MTYYIEENVPVKKLQYKMYKKLKIKKYIKDLYIKYIKSFRQYKQ